MNILLFLSQIVVSIAVFYVWIFRYEVIIKEFKQFELSDLTRTSVGAAKVALATLILAGLWYPELIQIPAICMGLFMLSAQYFHFKIKNPFIKHMPSLVFLLLCAFMAVVSMHTN